MSGTGDSARRDRLPSSSTVPPFAVRKASIPKLDTSAALANNASPANGGGFKTGNGSFALTKGAARRQSMSKQRGGSGTNYNMAAAGVNGMGNGSPLDALGELLPLPMYVEDDEDEGMMMMSNRTVHLPSVSGGTVGSWLPDASTDAPLAESSVDAASSARANGTAPAAKRSSFARGGVGSNPRQPPSLDRGGAQPGGPPVVSGFSIARGAAKRMSKKSEPAPAPAPAAAPVQACTFLGNCTCPDCTGGNIQVKQETSTDEVQCTFLGNCTCPACAGGADA